MDIREALQNLTIDDESTRSDRRTRVVNALAPTHCKHGHEFTPENTYVYSNGPNRRPSRRCIACTKRTAQEWAAANPIRHKELQRIANQRRPWRNPDIERARRIQRKYGITWDEFAARVEAQEFKCPLCHVRLTTEKLVDETGKRKTAKNTAVVDHDHESGRVRGVICASCNYGIGCFFDRPDALRAAADYLEAARSCEPPK